MQWILLVVGLVLGVAIGFLLARLRGGERKVALQTEINIQRERLATVEQALQKSDSLRDENEQLKLQLARLAGDRRADAEKLEWVEGAQQHLREAFEALASQKPSQRTLTAFSSVPMNS